MPYFYEPCCDGDINMKIPSALLPKEATVEKDSSFYYPYASFLLNKLPIYTEYAGFADDLPEGMLDRYLGMVEGKAANACWATRTGIKVDGATTEKRKLMQKQGSVEAF